MSEREKRIEDAAQPLGRAQQAVNRGDPIEMLDALAASGYLDGLTRRLQRDWGDSLPPIEVDDCIAQAVDAACAAVFKGPEYPQPGGLALESGREHCKRQVAV